MKTRLLTAISLAVCALCAWTACDTKAELPTELPKYPVKAPIAVAKATSGEATVNGVVDDDKRTITFKFDHPTSDIKAITVHLEYKDNVTPKDNAFTGDKTLDLTSDYKFTINNNVEDVEYTIHAEVTVATLTPLLSVSASAGSKSGTVELDNENHKIEITFLPGTDVTAVAVSIVYDERATPGKDSFEEKTIDLTNDYTFVVNNGLEDLTYTIHAGFSAETLLSYEKCSVYRVGGDADMVEGADNMYMSCLFDNTWMSEAEAYEEVEWRHFGWTMDVNSHDGHGNWFVFDISEPAILSSIMIWPYWPNTNNEPAEFRIFAWTGSGEPETWEEGNSSWELVLTGDHSELFLDKEACKNPPQDKVTEYIEAQYYCFVLDKNFYALKQTEANEWWYGRIFWCTMSELQIWVLQ